MSFLINTLNLLDDPDLLKETVFELRCVDAGDISSLRTDEDATLILAVDNDDMTPIHNFEDDMEPLGEIMEALLKKGNEIIWRDEQNEIEIEHPEELMKWLEKNLISDVHIAAYEALSDMF